MPEDLKENQTGPLENTTAQPVESQSDPPKRSGWHAFFTLLLGVVFVIAFLGFLAGTVVRRHLLDPQLYAEA